MGYFSGESSSNSLICGGSQHDVRIPVAWSALERLGIVSASAACKIRDKGRSSIPLPRDLGFGGHDPDSWCFGTTRFDPAACSVICPLCCLGLLPLLDLSVFIVMMCCCDVLELVVIDCSQKPIRIESINMINDLDYAAALGM